MFFYDTNVQFGFMLVLEFWFLNITKRGCHFSQQLIFCFPFAFMVYFPITVYYLVLRMTEARPAEALTGALEELYPAQTGALPVGLFLDEI